MNELFMKDNLNIETIHEVVRLLKKANNANYVTIAELAKELKTTKVKLMSFIEDNPKLIVTEARWQPKTKMVTEVFLGKKTEREKQVKGKPLGLCVVEVYLNADQNRRTIEWVGRMRRENEKFLYINTADNYGHIMGYYIVMDTEANSTHSEYLWRNTKEKLDSISEYFKEGSFIYGGFGDSHTQKYKRVISEKDINKLKEKGWTTNELPKLSKY